MSTAPQPAGRSARAATAPSDVDAMLVAAVRAGDEAAFRELLQRYNGLMFRLAMLYVSDSAVAEEVVQETWVGMLRGIEHFAGRSTFRTWLFRILTNRAKDCGRREGRYVSFSALVAADLQGAEPAVAAERFFSPGHPDAGHWLNELRDWRELPENEVIARETRAEVGRVIANLPPAQRVVIEMRDIEGWTANEVCEMLALTAVNQRVLLHRARAKVRSALERFQEER